MEPRPSAGNPNQWSPGVKWDVTPGSFTHLTELFGPMLGVMRFTSLREAIALVNDTGFGLTSGLESLDEREQEEWRENIRAGNLYINRPTTGAVVLRQPFGGMGKSCFGPGMKAGGPNYVAQFLAFINRVSVPELEPVANPRLRDLYRRLTAVEIDAPPEDVARLLAGARQRYDRCARVEFRREHDHFRLLGQDNFRRYLPFREVRVRVHPADSVFELFARVCAAQAAGCRRPRPPRPSDADLPAVQMLDDLTDSWAGSIEFLEETDAQIEAALRAARVIERLRTSPPPPVCHAPSAEAAAAANVHIADTPVLAEGRIELLWKLGTTAEQSVIGLDYHRA